MKEHMKLQISNAYLRAGKTPARFNHRSESPLFEVIHKGKVINCFEFHTNMQNSIAFFVDEMLWFQGYDLKDFQENFYDILQEDYFKLLNNINIKHQFISRRWSKKIQKELNKNNYFEKEII